MQSGRPKQPAWLVNRLLWKRSLGWSTSRLSADSGLNASTVRLILRRLCQEIDRPRSPMETRGWAVKDYQSGMGMPDIARKYGVGVSTVHRWVVASGVERRTMSQARSLVTGSHNVFGKKGAFHSKKSGRWVHTESTYEYARLVQLESDPTVASFDRCAHRITYTVRGRTRTYVPDFHIHWVGGAETIEEIKPSKFLADETVQAKASAAIRHLEPLGLCYSIITEHIIGLDLIGKVGTELSATASDGYSIALNDRRRSQRAEAQKAYTKRLRQRDIDAFRAKMAAYARAARAKKKKA